MKNDCTIAHRLHLSLHHLQHLLQLLLKYQAFFFGGMGMSLGMRLGLGLEIALGMVLVLELALGLVLA